MKPKRPFSVHSRIKSFSFAWRGLKALFVEEHNARIHAATAIIVLIICALLSLSAVEWCLIFIAIGLVFIGELLNTALEGLVDMVSPEFDARAGRIKDMAAAAVLFCSILAVVIGLTVIAPKLWGMVILILS